MPKKLFKPGNQAARGHGKGRPRLDVVSLADKAARLVLEQDIEMLSRPAKGKADEHRQHLARERISRMCRGRIPTRIALAGDGSDSTPVPFAYVEVAAAATRAAEEDA